MVGSLVIVIFSPQFKLYRTLRTAPDAELVLDAEVHRLLVPRHVPLLPEALVAQVAAPGLELEVDILLVPLEGEVGPESPGADVAVVLALVAILVLVPDVPGEIRHGLQTEGTHLLDPLVD